MKFSIEQIWIDEDAQGYPLTREIIQKLPEAVVLVGNEFADRSRKLDLESARCDASKARREVDKAQGRF